MIRRMGRFVGIDLGTTYSALATLDDHGNPVILSNREGEMLTPSAVLLLPAQTVSANDEAGELNLGGHSGVFEGAQDGELAAVVGQAALDVALEQPDRVATLIKRRMGETSYSRPIAGRQFRPETLSAILLRKLVQDAEVQIGPITRAIITVPAYFDDTRRKATKDAGRIAGLEVIDILDEPTAAALAYSFQVRPGERPLLKAQEGQTVLVYDLGGGTFDVTLVRLSRDRFQSLAIEGDVRLGGKDWDDRIVDFVAEEFKKQVGQDPRDDLQSLFGLRTAAERAKKTLSKLTQTTVSCTHAGKTIAVPITREKFETLTSDLLFRTRFTTQKVLQEAGLTWSEVDRVLLVGGSTHMPMTRRMLQELTGKVPDHSLAVSEVVARGAALHAGILAAHEEDALTDEALQGLEAEARERLGQVVEINVNAHSLGVEVKNSNEQRVNNSLVPKNTQLPTASSRVYFTTKENQTRVRVRVLQGEAPLAADCINIGEVWIDHLPANLPKHSPVQVRCGVGANGLVDVMALDMTSGRMARAVIHRSQGLSDEEIAQEAMWVQRLRIE